MSDSYLCRKSDEQAGQAPRILAPSVPGHRPSAVPLQAHEEAQMARLSPDFLIIGFLQVEFYYAPLSTCWRFFIGHMLDKCPLLNIIPKREPTVGVVYTPGCSSRSLVTWLHNDMFENLLGVYQL